MSTLRLLALASLCAAGCAHDAPARDATTAGWRETPNVQASRPADPRRDAYVMLDATRARCELALEHLADEAEEASTQRRAERVIASVLTLGSNTTVTPSAGCAPASGGASPLGCASTPGNGVFARSPSEDAAAERIAETNALAEDVAEALERLHEILEDETFDVEQAHEFDTRLNALERRCGLPI